MENTHILYGLERIYIVSECVCVCVYIASLGARRVHIDFVNFDVVVHIDMRDRQILWCVRFLRLLPA